MVQWILVSQRQVVGRHGDPRDSLEQSYVAFFERHGLIAVPVPNALRCLDRFWDGVKRIHGIVLSGGNDVSPMDYGRTPVGELDLSPHRDEVERALLDRAIRERIPVLGICRGMQFINVYFGGWLLQFEEGKAAGLMHPPAVDHLVHFVEEKARRHFNCSSITTNSYHNQAILPEGLADVLRPFAIEPKTGFVEGFYHPAHPIAGVQFHPERLPSGQEMNMLVCAFRNQDLYWHEAKCSQ